MRALLALLLLAAAPARADSALDYVEHLFGASNTNAVAGHGALTAAFSDEGDLTMLAWPGPGDSDQLAYLSSNDVHARALPHLGAADGMGSYVGLVVDGKVTWLRDPAWRRQQGYSRPDAAVPVTTFTRDDLGLTVTLTDVIEPDLDVLTRHVHVARAPGAAASALLLYENLSPTLSRIPQLPIADWAFDPHNDFAAVWDQENHAILHFHPGDRATFSTLIDLVNLDNDIDYGAVEALMRTAAAPEVTGFVAGLDESYPEGVVALVTTTPPPDEHQVGTDGFALCALIDRLIDNLLELPILFPQVQVQISPDAAQLLRCSDRLQQIIIGHHWRWTPADALSDLADGHLQGSPLAAAQTNGALRTTLRWGGDSADVEVLYAFGATRTAAAQALRAAAARPVAERQAASEQATALALERAPLPDDTIGPRVVAVAQRALVNLYVARDRRSGALLAAVTRQPPYYLDWPRDGAFLTLAADLAGRSDWVTQRDVWYAGLIRAASTRGLAVLSPEAPTDPDTSGVEFPANAWEMNYYSNGEPGGTIRFEIDNTALHIWALATHAAALRAAERDGFLAAVWPTAHAALDLLIRWKEKDSDLPAPANEDDNPNLSSTLHGAVAVYAGLVAGARLAHAMKDDGFARRCVDRARRLRAAIELAYHDPATGRFRAARGEAPGNKDSIGGWATGWLVWPARFFAAGDPRLETELDADMAGILAILRGDTGGGTYTAKNVMAAALYGKEAGSRAKAREAVKLLAALATPGTDAFGEVYLPGPDGGWSNRTATPHVWEGILFYLSAMALTDPSLFNREETELPLPPEAGGGCAVGRGRGGPSVVLLLMGLLWALSYPLDIVRTCRRSSLQRPNPGRSPSSSGWRSPWGRTTSASSRRWSGRSLHAQGRHRPA